MSGCHHYDGAFCVVCDDPVNSCCKDDKVCYDCDNEICRNCYDERKGECPVCNLEIVTDSQLIKYLLTKLNLSKDKAIKDFISEQTKIQQKNIKNNQSNTDNSDNTNSDDDIDKNKNIKAKKIVYRKKV